MAAAPYQQPPDFDYYRQPQWPADNKPVCSEEDELSLLDDKILDSTSPTEAVTESDSRRTSLDSRPNSFSLRSTMWQDPQQQAMYDQNRQQVHAPVPMLDTSRAQYSRMDVGHDLDYSGSQSWPQSAMSGTSTPTPSFEPHSQEYHSMPYSAGSLAFNGMGYSNQPYSATPMSPQSSQGEWMSANSSDGAEPHARGLGSPTYRTNSPVNGLRREEVRKKNTRFEIPNDRNLANIDSLILSTTDEKEKKELKQQKRLLRNRQAALDSRQRKKLHTEKLENEKKEFNQHMSDLQDENRQLREALQGHNEAFRQQENAVLHRQQEYEHYIQNLTFERDEAIRAKTLETAELRKQIDIFKDHIRDMERRAASGNLIQDYANQFSSYEDMGVEGQGWEEDFGLLNPAEYRAQIEQRAITPTPSKPTPAEPKVEAPFSWNAFYMCLLFGAFIASNSNSTSKPSIPALSEEYRAESANVLKALMSPGTKDPHGLLPSPLASMPNNFAVDQPHPLMPHNTAQGPDASAQDTLGALHATLTTPSRYQRESAAFGLSAANYDQLTNSDPFMNVPEEDSFDHKPTQLQSAFNAIQESRPNVDKVMNRGVGERSIMWDRVPEKVLRDFRRMVQDTQMRQ